MKTELFEGVNWVGYVDWNIRDFHGYETNRGSSYNAYLIQDEKNVLVDTVKAPYAADLLRHVSAFIDLDQLDYIVCNHAEPDHSGSLPVVMARCPQVEIICDAKCVKALSNYYDTADWKFKVVKSGDSLSFGKRSLMFVETPMAHWPESMASYMPEEKLLFSMDAFGQHIATSNRFDDEESVTEIMEEAKTYYANILMLYERPVNKAIDAVAGLEINMIAPSHGVIWRSHLGDILASYKNWSVCKSEAKVLVLYDTMWKSTEMMAHAIQEGAQSVESVNAKLMHVRENHDTLIATETIDAAGIAFGSPTLNQTMMPQCAATLCYLRGLKPAPRAAFAFGSYGWGRGGPEDIDVELKRMKFDMLCEPLKCVFKPTEEDLVRCREAGRKLAEAVVVKIKAQNEK